MLMEIITRCTLFGIFLVTEELTPFHRIIQPEEQWLYRNPVARPDTIPTKTLFTTIFTVPVVVILCFTILRKDRIDFHQALLTITLALAINGVVTNCIKLLVGRPRPDFLYRCFPDGRITNDMRCTGDSDEIIEGRKSFPSGHSSFSFTSLGFTSLFLASKLHCFEAKGRGQSWRLCVSGAPILAAIMIALTRTSDYRHHWQDVVVGSIIGFFITYVCYRQYYPSLTNPLCDRPYVTIDKMNITSDQKQCGTDHHPLDRVVVSNIGRVDSKTNLKHV